MTARHMGRRFTLRLAFVAARIDAAHLTHQDFAAAIGLSRSHWSQVVNGRRPATPDVRRAILDHPAFAGVDEAELWTVEPTACAA